VFLLFLVRTFSFSFTNHYMITWSSDYQSFEVKYLCYWSWWVM